MHGLSVSVGCVCALVACRPRGESAKRRAAGDGAPGAAGSALAPAPAQSESNRERKGNARLRHRTAVRGDCAGRCAARRTRHG